MSKKILNKNTIVWVRGGGRRGMVKDRMAILLRFLILGPFPKRVTHTHSHMDVCTAHAPQLLLSFSLLYVLLPIEKQLKSLKTSSIEYLFFKQQLILVLPPPFGASLDAKIGFFVLQSRAIGGQPRIYYLADTTALEDGQTAGFIVLGAVQYE